MKKGLTITKIKDKVKLLSSMAQKEFDNAWTYPWPVFRFRPTLFL